jgi:hypothetical protein
MEKIIGMCKQLEAEYKSKVTTSGVSGEFERQDESSSVDPLSNKPFNNFERWQSFKFIEQVVDKKSEFDLYFEEKNVEEGEDFDILLWWKINKGKYPTLSLIVRDIMAIPVSTVASESAFSTSGRHLSPHRTRLHPRTLEALMCTQSWLWAPLRGKENFIDIIYIMLHICWIVLLISLFYCIFF